MDTDISRVRIARGCHVPPAQAATLSGRCRAVLESTVTDGVIASLTAAHLHGLWLPENEPGPIHVATAKPGVAGRQMSRTRRTEFVAHRLQLRAQDAVLVDGVPTTSLARTWRDLACVLELAELVAAGDCALRAGASVDDLRDAIDAGSRRHNVRRARAALPLLDARSRSRPESHLRVAASAPDLPRFAVNEPISRRDGGWLAEPDLSLPAVRLALEYQGADHAEVTRMRRDITRLADMRREGWLVLTFGPAEVFGRPWQIGPEIRRMVTARTCAAATR